MIIENHCNDLYSETVGRDRTSIYHPMHKTLLIMGCKYMSSVAWVFLIVVFYFIVISFIICGEGVMVVEMCKF